ncbi:chemotaxis family two-component system sensor kinase Cph1 [Rhizobium sp. SG_E_25_P2]|uniref:ATP-binding protein n=1 Tax=Rhizobium sp. SG_E_25_P2 TaxID=2879942 RepID=UPI0024737EBF|nr:ATP-binding protein [Rhizobium sp. SG_E_25_P2]MDH6267786.1 chemotaxis family two-component system sensor kinase Cph1 [Rhizobium sp. SG_E_25_P2]
MTSQPDLDACAREPIHIPGAIQPHGALIAIDLSSNAPLWASQNFEARLSFQPEKRLFETGPLADLSRAISVWRTSPDRTLRKTIPDAGCTAFVHRSGDIAIIDFEALSGDATDELLSHLANFAPLLASRVDIDAALEATVRFVGQLSGFDRALIYRFDEAWNGQVLAEWNSGALPAYLGLHFPSDDIPAQARRLYALNRTRIIPDIDYVPVDITPLDPDARGPLDLSFSQIRSVSPIHLEYMRNMGAASSMSISIMVSGQLWGLVACHSHGPHYVSPALRDACDFAVQSLAIRISSQRDSDNASHRARHASVHGHLIGAATSAATWSEGLLRVQDQLLAFVGAGGAALIEDDESIKTVGRAPHQGEIRRLVAWLSERDDGDVIVTDQLSRIIDVDPRTAETASGLLAMRVSELHNSWLIWFRPEVVETVTWGGRPHKTVEENGRIHPRHSFDAWKEQVRGKSAPWRATEIEAARSLRAAIINLVLKKAEELAQLSEELRRSNKELEAFSYSVSHDLRAPFRHIVGFAQLLRERAPGLDEKSKHYLATITDSAMAAGRLVDDLLNFSQLGRTAIASRPVDMNKLVTEVVRSLKTSIEDRTIVWTIGDLPPAHGDPGLLRQAWFNLIENAVKYTRPRAEARIEISGECASDTCAYAVSDNGVGFDMAYYGKLFGVFQRLQRVEDFEGTGIGLALARRIIERHGGDISAVGEPGIGARFDFRLPAHPKGDRKLA